MADWELARQGRELLQARQPFAMVTVVRCERPAWARPGDQALIGVDGRLSGWVGGSYVEPVVVREALRILQEGRPCLVRLGAQVTEAPTGVVSYPLTGHSGGELEIFIDPCLPAPQLVLVGRAPLVEKLAELAAAAGYAVVVCDSAATPERFPRAQQILPSLNPALFSLDPRTYVVVATFGEADEEALAIALRSQARYVALVASRRRAAACRGQLLAMGLKPAQIDRLKSPAGLDLGAETPGEIAASILAELVQVHCAASVAWPLEQPASRSASDPVCGMSVEPSADTLAFEYQSEIYYFCCSECRRRFASSPQQYLAVAD